MYGLVFFGAGAKAAFGEDTLVAYIAAFMVSGFYITAASLALMRISEAHFNPAVTLAFAATRRFPWRSVPAYWAAQLIGALLASASQRLLFPKQAEAVQYGATWPRLELPQALVLEALLTFYLALISIAGSTSFDKDKPSSPWASGMAVALIGLVGGRLSGGSMNPAKSLGPALFAGGYPLETVWIYFLSPLLGGLLAAAAYSVLFHKKAYADAFSS